MASTYGLKFTHSPSIDPLKRHCSAATIQSDPKGHFAMLIDQLRKQENYENVLLQINTFSGRNNLELLKFVSNLEGMSLFTPKVIFKGKDDELAIKERFVGNEAFQKGNFTQAFIHYSYSIMKADYPKQNNDEKDKVKIHKLN